jgi:hypothetical protein
MGWPARAARREDRDQLRVQKSPIPPRMTDHAGWRDIGAPAPGRLRVSVPRRDPCNSGRQSARDVSGLPPARQRNHRAAQNAPAPRLGPARGPGQCHYIGMAS